MIAVVYIGERRFDSMTQENHARFLQALGERYPYRLYDVTHGHRTWSTQGLCGEQAQMLDMHHALDQVTESIIVKLRTDVWICAWAVDDILDMIEQTVNRDRDFSFAGPHLVLDPKPTEISVLKQHDDSRWTQDLIIIFHREQAQDVPRLLATVTDLTQYQGNKGWWLFACPGSRCHIAHCDVYLVRQARSAPSDFVVVEDWFDRAIIVMQGTPAHNYNIRLRDQWRSRYRKIINENTILEQ